MSLITDLTDKINLLQKQLALLQAAYPALDQRYNDWANLCATQNCDAAANDKTNQYRADLLSNVALTNAKLAEIATAKSSLAVLQGTEKSQTPEERAAAVAAITRQQQSNNRKIIIIVVVVILAISALIGLYIYIKNKRKSK